MALFDEVRKNGFVEGANLSVDADGWGLTEEQFPVHAADLVKAQLMSSSAAEIVPFAPHRRRQRPFRSWPMRVTW